MIPFTSLLFDLDGTLLDTAPDFITSVNILLARHERAALPAATIRAQVTNGSAGLVESAFGRSVNDPDFESLRDELLAIYRVHLADETALFPGLDTLLLACEARAIPWGIVTNKPWEYTEAALVQLKLMQRAHCVICPDHVKKPKPDPESMYLACQQLERNPTDCIYVGDHIRDIQAGRQAGMTTIAAAWGYIDPDEDINDWGADWTVEQPADLLRLLFED